MSDVSPPESDEDVVDDEDQKSKTPRRGFLKLLVGGGAILGGAYVFGEPLMAALDPEAAKAIEAREIYKKIEETEARLDRAIAALNSNASDANLISANTVVLELVDLVNQFKKTGIKVNSGVVYSKLKRIGIGVSRISDTKAFFSGNAAALRTSLYELRNVLTEISSPDIEAFSNNTYVNIGRESPRNVFISKFNLVFGIIKREGVGDVGKKKKITLTATEVEAIINFLEEYEFELQKSRTPKDHDRAEEGLKRFAAICKTMEDSGELFNSKKKVTKHDHIGQFQRMLAIGGYLAYTNIDREYGPKTDKAVDTALEDISDHFVK